MKEIKVAIVHDYLKEYGGAERVLEALHELYPQSVVFTSFYLPSFLGPHEKRFASWDIRTSWAQKIPFKQKLVSPLRLLSAWFFTPIDFSGYDLIIVSATGAYFPNRLNKQTALQLCYCHTPPRYLYGYATARHWKKHKIIAAGAMAVNHILRMVDYRISNRPDYYIANSREVAGRIMKFYRREALVIYPPVKIPPIAQSNTRGEYFATGGRLARAKHVDLVVKACLAIGVPLKVFGKSFAGYEEEIRNISDGSGLIEFLGEITDEQKYALMRKAKAFIFASEDEDFGIVPVEAMGQGTPVIAYRSGGVKETVIEGKTGIFFDELTLPAMTAALQKMKVKRFDPAVCRKTAERFSEARFKKEIAGFVEKCLSNTKR